MVVAVLFVIYTAGILSRNEITPAALAFFGFTLGVALWTGFSALKLLHTDPVVKFRFYQLLMLGVALLPPSFALFVFAHTDRERLMQTDIVSIIWLPALVFILILFGAPELVIKSTELHENGLVVLRVNEGIGLGVFGLYAVSLFLFGLAMIGYEATRVGRPYYPQAALFGVAGGVPMTVALLTDTSISPFSPDTINLVPPSMAIPVCALGLLLFRYGLFDLPPLAYATAMKHSPNAVVVLDTEDRIVDANDSGHQLLDSLGGSVGKPVTDSFDGFDPNTRDEILRVETTSESMLYLRPLVKTLTRGGRHVGWVVVLQDITAEKQQQQQLQRQNERLEQFASIVAHDLRNPLHVASGRARLIDEECDTEHIEALEEALARMDTIIDDTLRLARAGQDIETTSHVPIGALAREAWKNVHTGGAELAILIDDEMIDADESRLTQMFENLFRNAVEHNESGVRIRVGLLDSGDGFYVEDTGEGVPTDTSEEIFTHGYTTNDEGSGFGLAIVRNIVNAHGWTITVTESDDGGARFEIQTA